MEITAVVVTYGDRWSNLEQVLKNINNFTYIKNIVIINNGGGNTNEQKISHTLNHKEYVYKVLSNNEGSAGGFHEGIKYAKELVSDYILLLDDDTKISLNAFEEILKIKKEYGNECFCLNRGSWSNGEIQKKCEYYIDSFFRKNFINDIFFKSKFKQNLKDSRVSYRTFSTYSGFLFPNKALKMVGLPNKNYYLYVDDTDFTYRFALNGFKIIMVNNAEMFDIEESWSKSDNKPMMEQIFLEENPYRGLINLRNRVFFEKKYLVKNKFKYLFNKQIYIFIILVKFMPKNISGLKTFFLIRKAINQGSKGKLGPKLDNKYNMSIKGKYDD